MSGLSLDLAHWASNFALEHAPAEVVHNAKLRLLDIIGVMIASDSHASMKAARQACADADTGGQGAYSLLEPTETSPSTAAFLNGVASAVLEFDDTHIASNIHVTGVLAAALLPVAEREGVSGRALLEALIVGSEIACRLGLVTKVRMHENGFHPTSVYGVFAAAYAVARLRKLPPNVIADAVGTAGSLSAGSIASFQDGTSTKTMHVGFAASAAIRAVALANAGISGPSKVFEGRFGWYASHIQDASGFDYAVLTEGLGTHWEALKIAPKLYPCAYTMMPFILATLQLREAHGITPDAVEKIECRIMKRSFGTICEPVEEKRRPLTSWHGRISLQHTVAEALALGRFDKDSYAPESLVDPDINALADKVEHAEDPIATADPSRSRAMVSITLKDGMVHSKTIEDMLGTANHPASDAVYMDKFRTNVAGVLAPEIADRLVQQVLALEECASVGDVVRPLRSGRS